MADKKSWELERQLSGYKALVALPEASSSIPSIHTKQITAACSSRSTGSQSYSGLCRHQDTHTHTQTIVGKKFPFHWNSLVNKRRERKKVSCDFYLHVGILNDTTDLARLWASRTNIKTKGQLDIWLWREIHYFVKHSHQKFYPNWISSPDLSPDLKHFKET